MRHKILKNAAVEINCEMMHTLKSVSLLINLQEHSNVFRMNSRQNGKQGVAGTGGAQVTRETRLPNGDFTLFSDVNELSLSE